MMYIVVFNWRGIALLSANMVAGIATAALLALVSVPSVLALSLGLLLAGASLLTNDYVFGRRRDLMGRPLWRLLDPQAGGHFFFVPCWVLAAPCVIAGSASVALFAESVHRTEFKVPIIVLGFAFAALPVLGDLLRPFNRFVWSSSRESEQVSDQPQ